MTREWKYQSPREHIIKARVIASVHNNIYTQHIKVWKHHYVRRTSNVRTSNEQIPPVEQILLHSKSYGISSSLILYFIVWVNFDIANGKVKTDIKLRNNTVYINCWRQIPYNCWIKEVYFARERRIKWGALVRAQYNIYTHHICTIM